MTPVERILAHFPTPFPCPPVTRLVQSVYQQFDCDADKTIAFIRRLPAGKTPRDLYRGFIQEQKALLVKRLHDETGLPIDCHPKAREALERTFFDAKLDFDVTMALLAKPAKSPLYLHYAWKLKEASGKGVAACKKALRASQYDFDKALAALGPPAPKKVKKEKVFFRVIQGVVFQGSVVLLVARTPHAEDNLVKGSMSMLTRKDFADVCLVAQRGGEWVKLTEPRLWHPGTDPRRRLSVDPQGRMHYLAVDSEGSSHYMWTAWGEQAKGTRLPCVDRIVTGEHGVFATGTAGVLHKATDSWRTFRTDPINRWQAVGVTKHGLWVCDPGRASFGCFNDEGDFTPVLVPGNMDIQEVTHFQDGILARGKRKLYTGAMHGGRIVELIPRPASTSLHRFTGKQEPDVFFGPSLFAHHEDDVWLGGNDEPVRLIPDDVEIVKARTKLSFATGRAWGNENNPPMMFAGDGKLYACTHMQLFMWNGSKFNARWLKPMKAALGDDALWQMRQKPKAT